MRMLLYDELTPWYRLIDPPEDHEEEADHFTAVFRGAIEPAPRTLLELGSGAGHNALFMKRAFACTLTDIAEPMLVLSRELNPECEHVLGDMRTLRLARTFDAVLLHDAITYMTTEADLRAALATAFAHTRPGGAAIFAPDTTRESFRECAQLHENSAGDRALRCLEWNWDPDPTDTKETVEFAFLLRDGTQMQAVHDRHEAGLFPRETWLALIREVGFVASTIERPLEDVDDEHPYTYEIFLGRRP